MKGLIAPILLASAVFLGAVAIGVLENPVQSNDAPDGLPRDSWTASVVQIPGAKSRELRRRNSDRPSQSRRRQTPGSRSDAPAQRPGRVSPTRSSSGTDLSRRGSNALGTPNQRRPFSRTRRPDSTPDPVPDRGSPPGAPSVPPSGGTDGQGDGSGDGGDGGAGEPGKDPQPTIPLPGRPRGTAVEPDERPKPIKRPAEAPTPEPTAPPAETPAPPAQTPAPPAESPPPPVEVPSQPDPPPPPPQEPDPSDCPDVVERRDPEPPQDEVDLGGGDA